MRLTLIVALLWCAPGAFAGFRTGSDVAHDCKVWARWQNSDTIPATDATEASRCIGYIQGAIDAYIFTAAKNWARPPESICVPQGFKDEQAILIVLKYLDNHPEILHLDAGGIVWTALHSAFPCPI